MFPLLHKLFLLRIKGNIGHVAGDKKCRVLYENVVGNVLHAWFEAIGIFLEELANRAGRQRSDGTDVWNTEAARLVVDPVKVLDKSSRLCLYSDVSFQVFGQLTTYVWGGLGCGCDSRSP